MKIIHKLVEENSDRQLEFCDIMAERIVENLHYLSHVCFSDEMTFFLNGKLNTQNSRYGMMKTRIYFLKDLPSFFKKLMCGRIFSVIIFTGPIFIEGNVIGACYHQMLQDTITPLIEDVIAQNQHEFVLNVTFQQDGAPPHYFRIVRNSLDAVFPGGSIGRRGPRNGQLGQPTSSF